MATLLMDIQDYKAVPKPPQSIHREVQVQIPGKEQPQICRGGISDEAVITELQNIWAQYSLNTFLESLPDNYKEINPSLLQTSLKELRVYERQDIEECQTLKSCVLIDEIEKDLHGLENYQETHSYISEAIPELKPFLESNVVPVTGDWPTWYFHKKMQSYINRYQHGISNQNLLHLSGLAAECILQIFERVASNLGKSKRLPRKLNKAGKPYGKSNYYLASFQKEFTRKSLPLGYRWPSSEPDPNLECDSEKCTLPVNESTTKRLTCGHTFHLACLGNTGCSICFKHLMQDINKVSEAWNLRLLGNDVQDDNENNVNPDTAEHDTDDIGSLISKSTRCSKDPDYVKSEVFKQYLANKASKIAELLSKTKGSKPIQLEIEE
ncbi:uncharacterized protein LOC114529256 [Dendronephthya gigantea]|uniref:uncharacterized protein LOC114529256 n=1 Tax=Dendronephthya gigantea TaxID=151771 RepID=UPI0010699DCD|nr:uncharacterized protein LOC114529256 [Dendronephthya gigantea]